MGAISFLKELIPNKKRGKKETDRVASPESNKTWKKLKFSNSLDPDEAGFILFVL